MERTAYSAVVLSARCRLHLLEWQQFGCGNDKFREATVQTDQNTLASIDRGNLQATQIGETGCKLPVQPSQVLGIANPTSHFFAPKQRRQFQSLA